MLDTDGTCVALGHAHLQAQALGRVAEASHARAGQQVEQLEPWLARMIVHGRDVRQEDEAQLRRVAQHPAGVDEKLERRVDRRHPVARVHGFEPRGIRRQGA